MTVRRIGSCSRKPWSGSVEPTVPSDVAHTAEAALAVAERIGYPVIVRPAFTLGGAGGGVAENPAELAEVAKNGLDASPISQILVERYIYGWKEIEFETMRDARGNAIAVCSMENVDPVGVHTGRQHRGGAGTDPRGQRACRCCAVPHWKSSRPSESSAGATASSP